MRALVPVLAVCAAVATTGSDAAAATTGTSRSAASIPTSLSSPSARTAGSTAGSQGTAGTAGRQGTAGTAGSQAGTDESPIPVSRSNVPLAGRRLSSDAVLAIAGALPKMRSLLASNPGAYGWAYLKGPFRWQVSYFSRDGRKEIGQVTIDDLSGRVLEQWTGFQVAWTMARGYPGAFGRHAVALYVWLPLCALFLLPFVNPRRPLSLLHLDLLVLLSFSISLAFFSHGHIEASVPLAYPPLVYLLVRMLVILRRRPRRPPGQLRLLIPPGWLALAVVFLLGFRIGLNVTDGNVIDVGYAGVIGAERIATNAPLYGSYPKDNERGDTYGPVNYEAYLPFEQLFGWSGRWDDLPAAHAAAVFFDVLAVGLLFLVGRRMRGPTLGIALAYAWVSFPFTLFTLDSDSNDTLVAVAVLALLLASTSRGALSNARRGGLTALAALTKFAPLALAPLIALGGPPPARRARGLLAFAAGFALLAGLAMFPALRHDSLRLVYERTIEYQANRESPFSVWGLYGGLSGLQLAVQLAALGLALALAVLPRRADLAGVAAACAAILIAIQLGIEHWFYLYIPWFFPLVIVALLGRLSLPPRLPQDAASAPARSSLPAAVAST